MKGAGQQLKTTTGRLHLSGLHWLVIIASFVLTLVAWWNARSDEKKIQSAQFEYQTAQILDILNERMDHYHDALASGVASLHANQLGVTLEQWRVFSEVLSIDVKYPGIMGIGIIYHVQASELPAFMARQHQQRPDFTIHPEHTEGEYWPITYIEPVAKNFKAVGLDMAHETNRFTAAKLARDTGLPQITGPIILVQDEHQTPGFLFYMPYYQSKQVPEDLESKQAEFVGLVYAPFIVKNLMSGALANQDRLINFKISDGSDVLYDELSTDSVDYDPQPMFSKKLVWDVFGRQWTLEVQTTQKFRALNQLNISQWFLIAGLLIEALLVTLFALLAKSHHQAEQLAQFQKNVILEKDQTLKTTLNHMADGLILVNAYDQLLQCNKEALLLFGAATDDEVLTSEDLFSSVGHPGCDLKKYHDEKAGEFELTFERSDGAVPVSFKIKRFSLNGEVHYIASIRDMSTHYQTQASLVKTSAKLAAAIESSAAGFIIIDRKGNIRECNQAWLDWSEWDRESMEKHCYFDLLPASGALDAKAHYQDLFSGLEQSLRTERQFLMPDGTIKWGMESAAAIDNGSGRIETLAIHVADIQREMLLLSHLKAKNISLEKSNSDLEQFAYIASHDLRSPLNAIMQLATWVKEDCGDLLPEASQTHLELMQGRALRMSKLLEDLLDYSRVNRFKYPYENISLNTLVNEQFSLLDGSNDFTMTCDDVVIEAPKIPFEIMIRNLLSNAIKHHENDQGRISVRYLEQAGMHCIEVEDDGQGIPEEMFEKIFEMFQTLQSRDDKEGSGMGLAMIKRIIIHYGGEVTVRSKVGQGTVFVLSWPDELDEQEEKDDET